MFDEDYFTNTIEDAAEFERNREDFYDDDDRPSRSELSADAEADREHFARIADRREELSATIVSIFQPMSAADTDDLPF